jgi:hypothetical protein
LKLVSHVPSVQHVSQQAQKEMLHVQQDFIHLQDQLNAYHVLQVNNVQKLLHQIAQLVNFLKMVTASAMDALKDSNVLSQIKQ